MTNLSNAKGTVILVVGDLVIYFFSLILALTARYGQFPSRALLLDHLPSFSVLFVVFLLVSFIAGLYDKPVSFVRGHIQGLLFRVQIINAIIGVIFFYLAPVIIAPKANLIIYFIISTVLLFVWRLVMYPVLRVSRKQPAILVGRGEEIDDIFEEVNGGISYGLVFKARVGQTLSAAETVEEIRKAALDNKASVIVADLNDPVIEAAVPVFYSLVFSGLKIVDAAKLYETIFDRIPLSMVGKRWLIENSSTSLGSRRTYDALKRIIDLCVAILGGTISLVFYPFIAAAVKIEDGGPVFISQERTGYRGRPVRIYKFRSMSGNDNGRYGKDGSSRLTVTKVGKFLRLSRLDELPQFWNVLRGDLSLVGPRPEFPGLVAVYDREIPYYGARHLVKPGLFGWAQIYHQAHPHHAVSTADTRDKLSYDLYYVKNRSLTLDIKITLRTIQILMKRLGK